MEALRVMGLGAESQHKRQSLDPLVTMESLRDMGLGAESGTTFLRINGGDEVDLERLKIESIWALRWG